MQTLYLPTFNFLINSNDIMLPKHACLQDVSSPHNIPVADEVSRTSHSNSQSTISYHTDL